jgi:transglutaminase-like putative cysteine protease
MGTRVGLHHRTIYRYDRAVTLSPQVIRLRPAPHCRTPISGYSLRILPQDHLVNWLQDPYSNFLARAIFPGDVSEFSVEVNLVAELSPINPFDFFLEPYAAEVPFHYDPWLEKSLKPFLETDTPGPRLQAQLETIGLPVGNTIEFLVALNNRIQKEIAYRVRWDPGTQTCEETLELAKGSCRDTAWLLAQILRHLGLAARFVSGYLIQLETAEPSGPKEDSTNLHAWTEVYLPGAGWVGLDPTSGLLAGEGHIPLAATPEPESAAPISGAVAPCKVEFSHEMSIERRHETPVSV